MMTNSKVPACDLAILITGALRDGEAFYSNLKAAIEIAQSKSKAHIIISTWADHYQQALEAASQLVPQSCGFSAVSSRSLPVDFRGNWIRQSILLLRGLNALAPSQYVLKMRTDKTEWATNFANHLPPKMATDISGPAIFSNRIAIPSAIPLEPFFYNDMVFAGTACDLLQLVPKSMQPILEQWVINPEQVFHVSPLIDRLGALADFFRQNRGLPHGYADDQLIERNLMITQHHSTHLQMVIQSLDHLSRNYAFPSDSSDDNDSAEALRNYLKNDIRGLVLAMSTKPPCELAQHIGFNDSARSIVVTSSVAVRLLLERLRVLSDPMAAKA